jgi:FMN-dependent oxidoreductase (nitrilotriacetate monooxygenase family)
MKRMILSAFFFNPQGDHRMSWRHPRAPLREVYDIAYFQKLAARAEAAKLDTLFVADHVGMWDTHESNISHYANPRLEPITLLSALAAVTSEIGLLATISASYTEPYNLARMVASLDHISHGRSGWNVVTSSMPEEAMNFGLEDNIDHSNRYERAAEYIDLVKALWDSVEDEALLLNRKTGFFADSRRIHRINHAGKYLKVRGPLNVPRPPQGHPVIVQAGSSDHGKTLAAKHADIHFATFRTIEEAQRYRVDFHERRGGAGPRPEQKEYCPEFIRSSARHARRLRKRRSSCRRWFQKG